MKILKFSFLIFLTCILSCNDTQKSDKPEVQPGQFVHSVYFWLKNPTSNADKDAFLKSLVKFIDQSPNITTQHIGIPSIKERDVVEASFDFSLVLSFENRAAHDLYQEEEAHQTFRDEIGPLLERFIVYDSELID